MMRIGTKSVLVGAHQFLLHPLLLAIGWWREYGFARIRIGSYTTHCAGGANLTRGVFASLAEPRLWLAFAVHDLGYLGKRAMDDADGETHPELGARIMRRLCGAQGEAWGDFVLLHSRYYSKRLGRPVSALCLADKWVIVLEPWWLYLPRVWVSGELREYRENARRRGLASTGADDPLTDEERRAFASGTAREWNRALRSYMRRWIAEHRDGRPDAWTRLRHGSDGRAA